MKRLFAIFALGCLAYGAFAQDTYYAAMLSRNNYYGTARSVALGNAMTALGGDLGSVGINPAGSAVNSFGQITITPGLLFQSSNSYWDPDDNGVFGPADKMTEVKFNIPNVGGTVVLYTGHDYGLKYVTVGFLANNTNTFLDYSDAYGTNDKTSFLGNIAAWTNGIAFSGMGKEQYAAYMANQIGEFGPSGSLNYSGANQMIDPTDQYCYVPGTLNQRAMREIYGSKTDIILNIGFNLSDEFYFGFNLGLPTTKYRRADSFMESAGNVYEFPVNFVDDNGVHQGNEGEPTTYYKSSDNTYSLNTDADGIYGKFGFIWLPVKGLRVGAAFQTPTYTTVHERWQYWANNNYLNSRYDGSAASPEGEYSYTLTTPYIVDFGVAATLGTLGLFSIDYELADYSIMKYSDIGRNYFAEDPWAYTNRANKLFCGLSHSLRAGLEVKPSPEFAIRAGYSLVTDPERYGFDSEGNMVTLQNWQGSHQRVSGFRHFQNNTHAFSLGLGYSSSGSFFADAALRLTKYPGSAYYPYYFGEYWVVDKDNKPLDVGMPYIKYDRSIFDVLLTVGWRF